MTALQWAGLVWGALTLAGIAPTREAAARLTTHDYSQMCKTCRARRLAHWQREREWRYTWGHSAGPTLMVLATATIWWTAPFLPALRRLARLPEGPPCAGPPCAAHKRYVTVS